MVTIFTACIKKATLISDTKRTEGLRVALTKTVGDLPTETVCVLIKAALRVL